MKLKTIHYFSSIFFFLFVITHLCNHLYSLYGFEKHIEIMNSLRIIYRNIFIETLLMIIILVLLFSGLNLYWKKRRSVKGFFEQVQVWTGLYLAIFLVIHLSAIWFGRIVLKLDTNIYFGIAGLNTYPHFFFFIPYYSLAIMAFFGHLAAVHDKKMRKNVLGVSPRRQAYGLIILGVFAVGLSLYGLTAGFKGAHFPSNYNVLIGDGS